MRSIVAATCLVACVAQPAIAEPVEFEPSGSWALDYGEETCALYRSFASDRGAVTLVFDVWHLGTYVPMVLTSSDLELDAHDLAMRFDPDGGTYSPKDVRAARMSDGTNALFFTGTLLRSDQDQQGSVVSNARQLPQELQDRAGEITDLTLDGVLEEPMIIRTGAMAKPMQAVRDCVHDLYGSWGLDTSTLGEVAEPAQHVNLARLARKIQEAYPPSLRSSGLSATVRVTVMVDEDGKPAFCHAFNPEPFPAFAEAACGVILDDASYVPAKDAAGKPARSIETFTLAFSPN